MNREGYLKLKYGSNESYLKGVRAGFVFFLCGALYLTLFNFSVVLWTTYKLLLGGVAP